jgi:hypothetical protein
MLINVLKNMNYKYDELSLYHTYKDKEYTLKELELEVQNETEVGLSFVLSITESITTMFTNSKP